MEKVTKLDEYQRKAMKTLYYFESKERQLEYAVLALCGEAGELANVLKRVVFYKRAPYYKDTCVPVAGMTKTEKSNIVEELSDVLWYVACVADSLGIKLSNVATFNVNKITAKQRKTDAEFKSLTDSFEKMEGGGFRWRIDGKKWDKKKSQ